MPLDDNGDYVESAGNDKAHEYEASYYLNYHIVSSLSSLDHLYEHDGSYNWENRCQYYHYYTDHLLFSIGQIAERFMIHKSDSDISKRLKTMNCRNYRFEEDKFPILSNKKPRNIIEHIDEKNRTAITKYSGVGGFNLIDDTTEDELASELRKRRDVNPYTLDLIHRELLITGDDAEITISLENLNKELLQLRGNIKMFIQILQDARIC